MREMLTLIGLVLLLPSLGSAQGKMEGMSGGMMGKMHEMHGMHGMHGEMGENHLSMVPQHARHMLMMADELGLTEEQKKTLRGVEDRYLYPMIQKEAELKVANMKLHDLMMGEGFDAKKAKAQAQTVNTLKLEMTGLSIDAMETMRKAIGPEKLTKSMKMQHMSGTMSGNMGEMMKKMMGGMGEEEESSEHEEHH